MNVKASFTTESVIMEHAKPMLQTIQETNQPLTFILENIMQVLQITFHALSSTSKMYVPYISLQSEHITSL